MNLKRSSLIAVIILASQLAAAQANASGGSDQSAKPSERPLGPYIVNQSVEFGYRFTDVSSSGAVPGTLLGPGLPANHQMYDTLVNLQQGPRLLDQTLSIVSPEHNGVLFDDLVVSSFGFGGDPDNVARARVSKYKWFNFDGQFRRAYSVWDYNLLANPLNPSAPTSDPSVPIVQSPHSWNTVRRMTDLSATLLPQSRISVRLGYSRNTLAGLSSTTIPEASDEELIEAQLAQHNRVISDDLRVGIDFKVLPRTNISYDQFFSHTHNDNFWRDENFPFRLSDGTPADLGISWNTSAGFPCPTPPTSSAPSPLADTCSLYLSYLRSDHMHTRTPTEQLSLQSNYFRRVNIAGRVTYSNMDLKGPFDDVFNGFFPDTFTRSFIQTGPMRGNRISASADFGVTVQITNHFRISDHFRFYRFSSPVFWDSLTTIFAGDATTTALTPLTDPSITQSADHTLFTRFLGENTKSNEIDLEYDFSKRVGAKVGYRFRTRHVHHADEANDITAGDIESGEDIVSIDYHTGIVGFWVHPTDQIRVNVDGELTNATNFLTRIGPRRSLRYRARAQYKPNRRTIFSANATVFEARNGIQEISYNAHARNFGATATFAGTDQLALEFAYNYNNVASNAFVCFQTALTPAGSFDCANDTPDPDTGDRGAPFQTYQTYGNQNHYASANIRVKPFKRLTTSIGYSIVGVNGNATILNPLQPFGTLKSNYHRPLAEVQLEFAPGWSAIARWNYYGYNEKGTFFGPTAQRDFHANLTTLSLRYAF